MLRLAHDSGWDEALFVAIPLVVVAVLLALANRRAGRVDPDDRQRADRDAPGDSADSFDVDADAP